jgi:GT2 family glycosyltransferase
MTVPEVTVVMPAYQAAGTIEAAVASVVAQTRGDWELVVVDDGSSDGTAARVERLGEPRARVLRKENGGPAAARNAGIATARGRLVSFLDADDLWLPTYLETMTAALDATPSAGFAYTDAWVLDDVTGRIRRTTAMAFQRQPAGPETDAATLLAELTRTNFVYTSTTVRREVLEAVGGFRPSLQAAEDYELWFRIAAHGYGAVRAPGILAIHREWAGSQSADPHRMHSSMRDVYLIVASEYDVPEDVKAGARRQAEAFGAAVRELESPTTPSLRGQAARATRAVRRMLSQRRDWFREPPGDVGATLAHARAADSIAGRPR